MKHLLARFVRLFPQPFRDRFAGEMLEHIEGDYDRARSQGRFATLWFACTTALDLLCSAAAEHVQPSVIRPHTPHRRGSDMRWELDEWTRDLRHGLRALARAPGFTTVAVVTLGLAIGANAALFSVVNTVLLHSLPYRDVDRVVHIAATAPGSQLPGEFGVSSEFYVQYRERSRLLEDVSTYNSFTSTMRAGDRVERIRMSWPTNSLFSTLGAKPILGRLPVAQDEERVAVISYALWQSWFGGDSSVVGRSYEISGVQRLIIGVMAPEFQFPNEETMLWISSEIRPEGIVPGQFGTSLVARMRPGVTVDAVANELTALARQLPERFGGSAAYARIIQQHHAVVRTIEEQLLGKASRPLWVLAGAVAMVLLIACLNVANLFMVRAEGRQRDLAVRRAIGAGRGRLIRSQMAEAVIVAALAGALAVLLAWESLPLFLRAAPPGIPRLRDVELDVTTLLFTLAVAVLAALACGLVPAIRASAPDLARLREGGRSATRGRHWTRNGLVVAQTSLALVLLIGSGLLVRSFWALRHVNPGYDTKDVFTFQIAPEGASLQDGPAYAAFHERFMDRLAALPGVRSVGVVENVPLNESTRTVSFRNESMASTPDAGTVLNLTYAGGDYFRTMGIRVLAGRPFLRTDNAMTGETNVVISQSAAKLLWPGRDAIGRRLQQQGQTTWCTVVGVVNDVMQDGLRDTPQPLVYLPLVGPSPKSWVISSPAYVVKTARAEYIAPEVRALVREVAPTAPMYRVFTMAGLAADSMVQLSFTMLTLGVASMLALILGTVGLYGVLSYVVAERTREIGVRMALGAEAGQVRRMVVVEGTRVVVAGVVIGIIVAVASTRALGSLLFGVTANDPLTFAGMSLSLILVGMLASYVPARRASHVEPIESLRNG